MAKRVILPPIKWKRTANQSQRVHGVKAIRLIVVHTPEGSYGPMIRYITVPPNGKFWEDDDRRVSYHGMLREDGDEFTQFVGWDQKAWHAGAFNSLSEGISAAGFAAKFNVKSNQSKVLARIVAFRLRERGLPARWSRDGGGKGFCRHADLQSDRKDPMSRTKWLIFVGMVKYEHARGRFRASWGKS